ncbi:tetratricopeptide repeat protein [Myroides pelagicus]|uniref:Tetratricopeptide repeat protein n=1 Tax=Myroides pelagicus TaxID=270914 RepID=A0A7K1GNL4_9FLAO|nr:tetratricopeptide repeat protein [Myroides pelagicus]MEC4114685.1 tetratricopeptide repeat protein [Myroides pelagicus]MTH30475.1 tetratricopeptide repeat protein [Myroides pelagicus]
MHLDNEEEEYKLTLSRFESMLKTNKVLFFDSEEFENIILHYLDSGKLTLAKKALKLALEQHPNSTNLKLVEVELLVFQNKLEAADRLLDQIEEVDPSNDEVHIQRATVYSKKGNHQDAVTSLLKALTLTEDLADVHSLLGMEYLLLDEIELAKDSFINCLENDEEDQSALYNVIYCFDFLSEHNEAIDFLTSYIDKKPYSEIAWHQLGRQYYTLKNYTKAVWAFDYATLIDDQFLGAYLEKGKSLEKLKKYKEAIENYVITLELDDPTSYVLLRIGICYEVINNFPQAMEYYKRAVHEDPLLDKGWLALTDISIKEQQYEKALIYLHKAISIDEFNDRYWLRYAVLNKTLLNFKEAEKGYQKAAELGNNIIEHWIGWADTLYVLGQYDDAILKLLQAISFDSENADVLYRLAVLYITINEFEQGTKYLEQALHKDFDKKEIIKSFFPIHWENPFIQNTIKNFN